MSASSFLTINSQIAIPRSEIRFSFVRSAGPGGQNVNKVASKAVMRWPARTSTAIPDSVRVRLLTQIGRRINDRGELVLSSQRYRDQAKNVEDCLEKLQAFLIAAATVPKKRRKTRVSKAAREARLHQKRVKSERKRSRRSPSQDQ